VLGKTGQREGFGYCLEQAVLSAFGTLTAQFWEQMRKRPGFASLSGAKRALIGSGRAEFEPKEFEIDNSHLPGEHPGPWLLCGMGWDSSISCLLNLAAVHKSVENTGGVR